MDALGMNKVFTAMLIKKQSIFGSTTTRWIAPFGYNSMTEEDANAWFETVEPSMEDFHFATAGTSNRAASFKFVVCNEVNSEKYWPEQEYVPFKQKEFNCSLVLKVERV